MKEKEVILKLKLKKKSFNRSNSASEQSNLLHNKITLIQILLLLSGAMVSVIKVMTSMISALGILKVIDKISPKSRFYVRSVITFMILAVAATGGVIISILCRIIGNESLAQHYTARLYYRLITPLIGWKFKIEGADNLLTRPAIFVSDHQSSMDIVVLGAVFPKNCTVTSKKSVKWIPLLGWFMALSDTVWIDRSNPNSSHAALNHTGEFIRKNSRSIWIFPEGTRSHKTIPELLPFKKGAFHLAVSAQVPIVPVVVSNYSTLYSSKLKIFESGTVVVRVLDPIPTVGKTTHDVNELVVDVREKMEASLKQVHATRD